MTGVQTFALPICFDLSLDGALLPAGFTPQGFVYSLSFRDPVECLVEDVGPDLF